MLSDVKRVEYHPGSHSFNFYFYTRQAAAKWAGMEVPFRRQRVRLIDVNAPMPGPQQEVNTSVWARQLGVDGCVDVDSRFRYRIHLMIMNTLVGVAPFLKTLQTTLGENFLAYSLDKGGPASDFSQYWELEFETGVCPTVLVDVHRLYWVDHMVIVHHTSTHKNAPCIACGSPKHIARTCKTPDDAFKTKNCIMFDKVTAVKASTTPATFISLEDVRQALTKSAEVEDATNVTITDQTSPPQNQSPATSNAVDAEVVQPKKPRKRNNRSKNNKPLKSKPELGTCSNPIDIGSDSDSSEVEEEEGNRDNTTKTGRPPVTATTIKRAKEVMRIQSKIKIEIEKHAAPKVTLDVYRDALMEGGENVTMQTVLQAIGVKPAQTPASGNCQFYSLAEAALQRAFGDRDTNSGLVKITADFKRGIRAAAKLNFDTEFPVSTRRALLGNVQRDAHSLSDAETIAAVLEYFDDVAESPSDPAAVVELRQWGGVETLCMAVKNLDRPCFLMRIDGSQMSFVTYAVDAESSRVMERLPETTDWIKQVTEATQAAVKNKTALPIVIAFANRHYTSLLFHQTTPNEPQKKETSLQKAVRDAQSINTKQMKTQYHPQRDVSGQFESESEVDMSSASNNDSFEDSFTNDKSESDDEGSNDSDDQMSWGSDEDTEATNDLIDALQDPRVSHDENQQLQRIINDGKDRKAELLAFLVTGLDRLSRLDQEELLNSNMEEPAALARLAYKHSTSEGMIKRWYRTATKMIEQESERQLSNKKASTGSIWSPDSDSGSSDDEGPPPPPDHQANQRKGRLDVRGEITDQKRKDKKYIALWDAQCDVWATVSKQDFPTFDSSVEVWTRAAQYQGSLLLHWLRQAPAPHLVLNSVKEPVIVELARKMREEVTQAEMHRVRNRAKDQETVRRLADWLARVHNVQDDSQRSAILADTDQWRWIKAKDFDGSQVLRLCQPAKRADMCRWMLAAYVFQDEFAELGGSDHKDTRSSYELLASMRNLMRGSKHLQTAFRAVVSDKSWSALAVALAHFRMIEDDCESNEY